MFGFLLKNKKTILPEKQNKNRIANFIFCIRIVLTTNRLGRCNKNTSHILSTYCNHVVAQIADALFHTNRLVARK